MNHDLDSSTKGALAYAQATSLGFPQSFSAEQTKARGCLSSRWLRHTFGMKGLKVMPTTLALYHLTFIALSLLPEDRSSDFNGLGKQLLGGFVLAVVVAVVFTFIKLRLRDKKPPAKFISISPEK